MRTNDNCCCYNNGHKHWLHYLLFEFVLQKKKKKTTKTSLSGRLLDSEITPLLSGSLTFLAWPQSTCKINAMLLIKDNVPTVFVFTKHLQRSATSLPILILLYG